MRGIVWDWPKETTDLKCGCCGHELANHSDTAGRVGECNCGSDEDHNFHNPCGCSGFVIQFVKKGNSPESEKST